jgi:hypothetical protein
MSENVKLLIVTENLGSNNCVGTYFANNKNRPNPLETTIVSCMYGVVDSCNSKNL